MPPQTHTRKIEELISGESSRAAPARFGDYEIIEEIAHGGMGVVYKARQLSLDRIVAVKMIRADRLSGPDDIQRFTTEARAAAKLQHPHIVAIHEVDEIAGQHFFSMDFVAGKSLSQVRRERPLSPRDAANYVQRIAEAIHYAHERGVLHRDLKPSNVLIDEHDCPRVTDFGLAKFLDGESELTVSGVVMGTPSFMPPEQACGRARDVTVRSDVYSLGAILYDLLCGRPPFHAESAVETLRQVVENEPTTPRTFNSSISRDLETICLKCLEKSPQQRYSSAGELAEELKRFLKGEPILARPVSGPERLWRWCKRKPALAVSAILILLVAIGSPVAALRINHARQLAERNRALAEANLYVADMNLALQAVDTENRSRALAMLKQHLPRKGEQDLRGFEWRYIWRQARGDYAFALGSHSDVVRQACFSPDGQLAASRSMDGTLKLWEVNGRRERFSVSNVVSFGGFSQDSNSLLISTDNESVHSVDTRTGQQRTVLAHAGFLVRALPDGKTLALSGTNFLLRLWDMNAQRELRVVPGQGGGDVTRGPRWSLNVAVSTNGNVVIAAQSADLESKPTTLEIRDLKTDRRIARQTEEAIAAVQVSDDGRYVAWGVEGTLHVWEWQKQPEPISVRAHNSAVRTISFSHDGNLIATGASDQFIRLWETATGKLIDVRRGHQNSVRALGFSPDDQSLLSGGLNEAIRVWHLLHRGDASTVEEQPSDGRSPNRQQRALAISGDSRWITMDSTANAASVLTLDSLEKAAAVPDAGNILQFIDATRFAFIARNDSGCADLSLYDTANRRTTTLRSCLSSNTSELSCAALSTDLRWAATGGRKGQLQFHNLATGSASELPAHNDMVHDIAFAPGGSLFATCSRDRTVKLWHVPATAPLVTFTNHTAPVFHVAFSPDGKWLATASSDKTIGLWDVAKRKPIALLSGHRHAVYGVAFSPDGGTLASGSLDNSVKLWNLKLLQEVANFSLSDASEPSAEKGVVTVAFSPDGNAIAARTRDGSLRVWRAAPWQQIQTEALVTR